VPAPVGSNRSVSVDEDTLATLTTIVRAVARNDARASAAGRLRSSTWPATAVGFILQRRTVRAARLDSYITADPLRFMVEVIGRRDQTAQTAEPGGMVITLWHVPSRYRG
jgi:hypothetical protein